jgi:hypothetical protein
LAFLSAPVVSTLPFKPLPLPAGASRRRLEVFSPKLARRLSLGSYDQWRCWLMLEANPDITAFCERPAHVDGRGGALIDFWVQLRHHQAGEFWLLCASEENLPPPLAPERKAPPAKLLGLSVRCITAELLMSLQIPLANWAQILPFLVSYREHRDPLLEQSIVVELGAWASLGQLFERFDEHSESLIQASVFWLVSTGRIVSDDLATTPLSGSTRFRRR